MSDHAALQRKIELQAQQIRWLSQKVFCLHRAIEEMTRENNLPNEDVRSILNEMDLVLPL